MGLPQWTFLSNHGHVLVALARDPRARLREVAEEVGITERTVQQIVGDLVDNGYLRKTKVGRRNQYVVQGKTHLRHDLESQVSLSEFLGLLASDGAPRTTSRPTVPARFEG